MKLLRRVVPALLLAAASTAAHADERILRFLSDVQVQKDSSLEVIETIDVRAENEQIRHGIYRDFPTRYRGRQGSQVVLAEHISSKAGPPGDDDAVGAGGRRGQRW